MRTKQVLSVLVIAAAFLCGSVLGEDKSGGSIESQLQGRWEVVAGVNQGRELLPAEIEGTSVSVTVNQIVTFDREENQRYKAVFVMDESSSPAKIDLTSVTDDAVEKQLPTKKDPTYVGALGIVKMVSPGKWMLCYSLPGADRPSTFESPVGSQIMLFTMSKQVDTPPISPVK